MSADMRKDAASGDAYGADVRYHFIRDDGFVCTAPPDAPCRTVPTCECENWCCCDGSPEGAGSNHDDSHHCCMSTAKSGRGCWIAVWVDAQGIEDSIDADYDAEGERITTLSDGPVACDWDDGIYLHLVTLPERTDS